MRVLIINIFYGVSNTLCCVCVCLTLCEDEVQRREAGVRVAEIQDAIADKRFSRLLQPA